MSERTEQGLMQRLAESAAELTDSWGALALLVGADGRPVVIAQHGLSRETVAVMNLLPRPDGLLGRVLAGEPVQLERWTDIVDPSSPLTPDGLRLIEAIGNHTGAFLGVPILDGREVLGAVYVGRTPEQSAYDQSDLCAVQSLVGATAGLALALRHRSATDLLLDRLGRVEARRVGDDAGAASFTVRRLLSSARRVLDTDLAYLTQMTCETETVVYVDAGPGAPPLQEGEKLPRSETYCGLLLDGIIPASVPDLRAHPATAAMRVTELLGARSYCGTPVTLPDGTFYGTLCGLSGDSGGEVSSTQLAGLRVLAELIGVELSHEQQRERSRRQQLAEFELSVQPERRAIHLQPIVDLATGRPLGFEALSRFTDANDNPRRPDLVFERAARLGMGVELELQAAEEALRLMPIVPDGCYLSVNLSPQALISPAAFGLLTRAVAEHPGQVVVELTEHERVSDYPALLDVLAGLRERGLRLAIDDTGAGYASLQHVTRMNPDIVKLDIAFVRDVHLDAGRRAVARALIAFAGDVGAELVAEGVETEAEAAELRRLGARFAQGYLFGHPQAAPDAVRTSTVAGV
ncbi:EAL domain-containing protein [Nocardioides mangrovicus]|uniref:EAL domain-containing protein n=1 Tax=Nocardioides mangrovicus TaxID=2478913 RepID=UPI001313F547|nr:EAL domain-containing protein [Nocardioides mangrovicus]